MGSCLTKPVALSFLLFFLLTLIFQYSIYIVFEHRYSCTVFCFSTLILVACFDANKLEGGKIIFGLLHACFISPTFSFCRRCVWGSIHAAGPGHQATLVAQQQALVAGQTLLLGCLPQQAAVTASRI